MRRHVGLWIDHRKAVVVSVTEQGEETSIIESDMEKHVRFSGSPEVGAEDQRDRQFKGHLSEYYDRVIASVRDAESILILGPGEAKGELAKRLGSEGLSGHILGIETVDKVTDRQLAARVRQRFGP
jgi:hypothetical protein